MRGKQHPDTPTSANNLAYAYQEAGRLKQAISLSSGPSPTADGCSATSNPLSRTVAESAAGKSNDGRAAAATLVANPSQIGSTDRDPHRTR
jgi:hypothetical protein